MLGAAWARVRVVVVLAVLVALLGYLCPGAWGLACRISEYPCRNGHCIRADQFCDAHDDCGDASDEPRHCTACNRTYYGEAERTYQLEVQRPRDDHLPFVCHLTFMAGGDAFGDLVQLMFDAFSVGRYVSSILDGCPDGYMTLSEINRPVTGGFWCGVASGYAVYYSETSTVTVTLKVFRWPPEGVPANAFEFRLRYKFVAKGDAVARYGLAGNPTERGELVPGTYCSRVLDGCHRRRCRLQSPNYPGLYPRNATCYYTVRQRDVPACKHALVTVVQEQEHKVQLKRSLVGGPRAGPSSSGQEEEGGGLRAWEECTGRRDHVIIYDGVTTDDAVLLKVCGGSRFPRVTSSGAEILVAFHSSPYGNPLHPAHPHPLKGFELNVEILLVDSETPDYASNRHCLFHIRTKDSRTGVVRNLQHTVPPNVTCRYFFQGHPHEIVWVYFLYYSREVIRDARGGAAEGNCTARLRLWDQSLELSSATTSTTWPPEASPGGSTPGPPSDASLLGDYCNHEYPRLCDHALLNNSTRATRPCDTNTESYVSTGPQLAMEQQLLTGTALNPLHFELRYEFVDTRLWGRPMPGTTGSCYRLFRSRDVKDHAAASTPGGGRGGEFWSPQNVFLFGRGGSPNLTCEYRFEASIHERVRLQLANVSFGGRPCSTETDPHSGRPTCQVRLGVSPGLEARMEITEMPWRDVAFPSHCLCSNASGFVFVSFSKTIHVRFTVLRMNISDDFSHFYFRGTYEFLKIPECSMRQRLRGYGGDVVLRSPGSDVNCDKFPWLIEARQNRSLFLRLPGVEMSPIGGGLFGTETWLTPSPTESAGMRCPTKNRLLVYSGTRPYTLLRLVCPVLPVPEGSGPGAVSGVELFSDDWYTPIVSTSSSIGSRPPSMLLEFVAREPGRYVVRWLEVSRGLTGTGPGSVSVSSAEDIGVMAGNVSAGMVGITLDCPYACPELNACISSALWCDGHPHCPSGFDEAETNCARFFLPLFYVYVGGAGAGLLAVVCLGAAACRRRRRRRRADSGGIGRGRIGKAERRVPTEELLIDPKEAIS